MPRQLKSQWEFGELFPAEEVRRTLTVSELTGSIRRVLEKEIGSVSVMGEITNLRVQSSGHIYFSIKDAAAQLGCVLFRNEARVVNRDYLLDGQKVVLTGEITVYEARGQYQLRVLSVQLQGVGALQAAFERLKQKLQAEGLFDQSHKRPIPRYAEAIGLVTSAAGAAIHDLLHGIERRNPSLRVLLAPCRVQGMGAGQEIAAAIHLLNEFSASAPDRRLDAIIVARGGGSIEDLWAFNEEVVARAIYSSALPVISAVGHEIDFTISDFVADLRAATPTAAAELITEGVFAARTFITGAQERLRDLAEYSLSLKADAFRELLRRLAREHPRRRLAEQSQRVDDLLDTLARCTRHHFRQKQLAGGMLQARFARLRPEAILARRRDRLAPLVARLLAQGPLRVQALKERLDRAVSHLRLLSPQHTLDRGYSITTRLGPNGPEVVRDPSQVQPGETLLTRVKRGTVSSTVK